MLRLAWFEGGPIDIEDHVLVEGDGEWAAFETETAHHFFYCYWVFLTKLGVVHNAITDI